jgi:hypothetical protein
MRVLRVLVSVLALIWPAAYAWTGDGISPVFLVEDAGAAARQAAGMTGGRVLDVQTRSAGAQSVYVVRVLLNDGRVKVIQIQGATPSVSRER